MPRVDKQSEPAASRPRACGHEVVLSAREAINRTERRLCGAGAVARPAVAEGLALQGRRAATLPAPFDAGPLGSDTASAPVAWVHHRVGHGMTSGFAFELSASAVQDAIDHCLVAHDLARRLGAPGLCTLGGERPAALERAELPHDALIHEFESADAGALPDGASDESILAQAERTFERVSKWTGRTISTVTTEGPKDAKYAIVASGASRAVARDLVLGLLKDGTACRLVCAHLVRPLPATELVRALQGIEKVWVLPADGAFVEVARRALNDTGTAADDSVTIDAARRAFGLEARAELAGDSAPAGSPLVFTACPAGGWAERFLLDAASRLATFDGMALVAEKNFLVAGRPPLEPAPDLSADVALCAHPSYIESPRLLARLGRRATLVVVSAGAVPDRWWDRLEPGTRETLLGRESNVHWLDLRAVANLDLEDPGAVFATMLDGLLAAAAPDLAETLDRTLDDMPSGVLERFDLAALETARAKRDAAGGPQGDSLPRMPLPAPDPDETHRRDATRRFHLTGDGAHSVVEPTQAEPLRPLVLDAVDTEAEASRLAQLDLDATTLPGLYAEAVGTTRRERWEPLRDEIRSLAQRLEELLALDDGRGPNRLSAKALESTLGADAGLFLDPEKLAASLRRQRGAQRLGDARRARIEGTLAALRHGLNDDPETDMILVRPDPPAVGEALPGVREIVHARGLGASIGLFDGLAASYTDVFRAVRVARLESDAAYDPELHDEPLRRLEWQGLGEDELLSLPRVVVLETDSRLRGAGLGAFAELLRSGRPVHVLVEQSTSEFRASESWQGLAGFHPGLGYLAVAHREAFVIESSLVRPERLSQDLKKMAASLRPGAALVAVPAVDATVPSWLQLLAAEHSRAMPCFTYDPEAGPNWAERFSLDGNPEPGLAWPRHTMHYLDDKGEEATLDQEFTFAHAVALDPAYRAHFRIVPEQAWSAEQMELGEYLAAPVAAVARKIPFIWVVVDDRLARAVVTRELAYASRDRLRAWRILQELAGTDNEYARRAAETARLDARAEANTRGKALEVAHGTELEEVRSDAVRTAMERLARRLVGVETAPAPVSPAVEVPATTQEVEEDGTPATIVDPYIDSALCTSCADCININPRLFKYDANKQAFIDDVGAGTYAQLVKAAEKCPARCIHPGLPAAGDKTANDKIVARAAKFN